MTDLSLDNREGLPEALRVLIADFPREDWPAHPHFAGLVAFWLDRHLLFRKLLTSLREDAERAVDGEIDPRLLKQRLSRSGGLLLNQLHGHHQIEDHHYFPVLAQMETRLDRGFELLDHDHHQLDGLLHRFADTANAVLHDEAEAGRLHEETLRFDRFLDRHLTDEEDLIVPVILKHGPDRIG